VVDESDSDRTGTVHFLLCSAFFLFVARIVSLQDDMASVSGRSVGVGSEVGELADITADENLQSSGILATLLVTVLMSCPLCMLASYSSMCSITLHKIFKVA